MTLKTRLNAICFCACTDGADFISMVHTVTFNTNGTQGTSISILDDKITEATESFLCIIFPRSHGLNGVVVENPDTISFAILDDDSKYGWM